MSEGMLFDIGREAYFNVADAAAKGEPFEVLVGGDTAEWLEAAEAYAREHDLPWPPPADEYEVARMKAREHDLSP